MRPPFLRDTLSVQGYLGAGARGPQYAAPATVRCDVQPQYKLLPDAQGRQATATALAIVRPENAYPIESRVTTSDGTVYRIIAANPTPDSARPDHIEWDLGSLQ